MAHSAKLIWIASSMFLSPVTQLFIFFFDQSREAAGSASGNLRQLLCAAARIHPQKHGLLL
jgi:hypothetical protein